MCSLSTSWSLIKRGNRDSSEWDLMCSGKQRMGRSLCLFWCDLEARRLQEEKLRSHLYIKCNFKMVREALSLYGNWDWGTGKWNWGSGQFISYATKGLENPFAYVLFHLIAVYFRVPIHSISVQGGKWMLKSDRADLKYTSHYKCVMLRKSFHYSMPQVAHL